MDIKYFFLNYSMLVEVEKFRKRIENFRKEKERCVPTPLVDAPTFFYGIGRYDD